MLNMIARAKQAFEHNSGLKAEFEAIRLMSPAAHITR